ncbi:acetylornithine deacetylase [Desertibaculum subflavum]|uniref:acetylornithine deacetylase n=1 Tax=Desertibaculum subflavum TaxID=2268458 RepID=UPI000E66550A
MTAPSPASIDMIERLIGFQTVSRDSNLELIHWVQGYLKELGVECLLSFEPGGRKANLYATLGPKDRPGVLLSGHTDVVPIDGQEWVTDPFKVARKGDKLYGRGTCDMKSFVAIALAMAPDFLKANLKTPIHYAFSFDEEVGCIGVRHLIEQIRPMPVKPKACIVGEPTEMKVVIAHKGKRSYICRVRGLECHSSLAHTGVNAVEAAAEIVAYMKGMARERRARGPFDQDYSPPYTTIHTGLINGGTALNIVPKDCEFVFEWRYLPDDDPEAIFAEVEKYAREEIEPEMKAVDPSTGISFEEISGIPGLDTTEDAEVTALAKALTGGNSTYKVSFGTEAGLFQEAGIPTIVCGPGSIDQAHKPNEFIALDQITACEAFLTRLKDRCAAA